MRILISGGTGFLGRELSRSLLRDGHRVYVLVRGKPALVDAETLLWDGKKLDGWEYVLEEVDAVIHLAGRTLASWPWTTSVRNSFYESRVRSGSALVDAIRRASKKPGVFIQQSGINYYGLSGDVADEWSPPAEDFLAHLAVKWEEATTSVEDLGVRRIVLRTSVVLANGGGLLPLMALPIRFFLGGRLGGGQQAMPWIHIRDWIGAVRHLIAAENTEGAYNLIAPALTSSDEFMKNLAEVLRRPYWFPAPSFLLRGLLGDMNVLILEGRFARPRRLIESGYQFRFPLLHEALIDLYGN